MKTFTNNDIEPAIDCQVKLVTNLFADWFAFWGLKAITARTPIAGANPLYHYYFATTSRGISDPRRARIS